MSGLLTRACPGGAGPADSRESLVGNARTLAFRIAYRRFRFTREDAEDVAQEVALQVAQRAQSSEVTPAWIVNGTVFRCVDHARRKASEARALVAYADEQRRCHAINSAREMPRGRLELLEAMRCCSGPCRNLLRMYIFEQKTWAEMDAEFASGRRCAQYRTNCCMQTLLQRFRGDS